jgi:CRP-like cAMP-binding protein
MLESFTRIPFFQNLEPAQTALIRTLFENFSCPPDTLIFKQGAPAVHLYLILTGTILIQYKPYDGPPITITRLSAGDVFGWSAVIGSPHYTSSIVSVSDVKAIRIRGIDLRSLVNEHPATGQIILDQLARVVSSRWKNSHTQVQSILKDGLSKGKNEKENLKEARMNAPVLQAQETQLRALLERLSAYVEQFHGGTVEFVSFDGTILKVRLGGACLDCPLLPSTLHGWVAGTVHQFFPDVTVVEEK